MTKPMLLSAFTRLPPASRACPLDGLSAAIDMVADAAPAAQRFLRYQYYATALALHGGAARTILIEQDGNAVIALPFVRIGPSAARLTTVPGVDAPFRGFPAARDTPDAAFDALIDALAGEINALRVSSVAGDDTAFAGLRAAAERRGWVALDRPASCAPPPDIARLVPTGSADLHLFDGAMLAAGGVEAFAAIEDHGAIAFWCAAAADAALAMLLSAAIARRDGVAVAFALYLDAGDTRHVVASGGDAALLEAPPRATTRDWLLIRPGLPALLGRALSGLWSHRPVDRIDPASL